MSENTTSDSPGEVGPRDPGDTVASTFAEYLAEYGDDLEELAEGSYPLSPIAKDILERIDGGENTC